MTVEEAEVLPQHADDFPRAAIQHDRAADDGWIAAKLRTPIAVRQDHGPRLCIFSVVLRERAAEKRLHPENRQDVRSHIERPDLFRFGEPGKARSVGAPETNILKAL